MICTRLRPNKGFTLIELIIAILIVSVLAAIAYPSYVSSVYRAHRTDATTALQIEAQTLERCYTQTFSYVLTGCTAISASTTSPLGYYTIKAATAAATYTLTATPVAGGAQANDAGCTQFTLSNTGAKCSSGTSGNSNCASDTTGGRCWSGR